MALKQLIPAKKTIGIKYAIRDIVVMANEVAKSGKEMLYLNIGDPNAYDHTTPAHMVESTYNAMKKNLNGYAPSSGIPEAIVSINRDAEAKGLSGILDTFVTTGASEAIEICLTAILNPGENFLMPTPGYPLYTAVQSKLECEPNPYYLDEDSNWQPDIEDIKSKINDKTKAIVIINPNNPTGSVCSKEILQQIADLAIEHNLLVISDEIYDKLLFDGKKHISIAALNKDLSCITFSGLSKNYVVPGFRIGWGVATGRPEIMSEYLEAVNKILRARVCANHPHQYSIVDALDGDQTHIDQMNETLMKRRDLCMDILKDIPGLSVVKPEGAFYIFAKIEVDDDSEFVKGLIKETGVVVVPGSGFGQKPGSQHFRIVILPDEDTLDKALRKIKDYMIKYNG